MKIALYNKENKLRFVYEKFRILFKNVLDEVSFSLLSNNFLHYIDRLGKEDEKACLEDFVEKYFLIRKYFIIERDNYMNYIRSTEFKEDNLLSKILTRIKAKQWQNICEKFGKFEHEFYDKVLAVEIEKRVTQQI